MPELPEVETVRGQLERHALGREIVSVHSSGKAMHMRRAMQTDFDKYLLHHCFVGALRKGKYLLLDTDGGSTLLIHLGMSGRVLVNDGEESPKHTHLCLHLGDVFLRMVDPRRFGLVMAGRKADVAALDFLERLGPDPFESGFTGLYLHGICAGRKRSVKEFLLQQEMVAGIGNIYACEALFRAGIHPARAAGAISLRRLTVLAEKLREVLRDAITLGGTTLRDFSTIEGYAGKNQSRLQVFQRQGLPCLKCAKPLLKIQQSGRSTFYCGRCQR